MQPLMPPLLRPSRPPGCLEHLTPQDQQRFLAQSFGPHRPIRFPVVHHAFEFHARTQPDALCLEHQAEGLFLTYARVDKLANRLARRIRHLTSTAKPRVCIIGRRSVCFVIAILAVLKSSGQYVPVDGMTVADDALRHIIRDARPHLVLCMHQFQPLFESLQTTVPSICLEQVLQLNPDLDPDLGLNLDDSKPEDTTQPEDGCYVIYTSGTTGVPKGVDVRHIGVSNVICAPPGNVHMQPGTRVAHLLNIAFDMGAWEILAALYNGSTLCLRGNTFSDWVRLLKSVQVVISTPSILARHHPQQYQNIKHIIVGGEVCPQSLADSWASYTQFNNCCGPTEISVCNTIQPHTPGYPLSIGTPIANTSVYILSQDYDPNQQEESPPSPRACAIGEIGCMWVGGIGVSNGYLNLPDKTRERWLPDPFRCPATPASGTTYMMFNTNDLGRWRPDGQLDHCGRADDQVKVKGGFRVELDGVASAMMIKPENEPDDDENVIRAAVALLVDGTLCAFLVPTIGSSHHEHEAIIERVEKRARQVLSHYAVPERWFVLDEFPTTRNGKVDKRALLAMARDRDRENENENLKDRVKEDDVCSSSSCSLSSSLSSSFPTTPVAELEDLHPHLDIKLVDVPSQVQAVFH